jgi:hypothetical protein
MLFPLLVDRQFSYCQGAFTGGDLITISNVAIIGVLSLILSDEADRSTAGEQLAGRNNLTLISVSVLASSALTRELAVQRLRTSAHA